MKVIVCIAKNEPNIAEWILYHLAIGFDHIYIYANNWEVRNYLSKQVTIIPWPGHAQQMKCYNHALRSIKADWLAFIDCDEYIVCEEGLDNFLKHQTYSVAMPWVIMGNKESEGKTVTERFRHWDYDPNGHVKTIVKGDHVLPHDIQFTNPHFVINTVTVTPRGAKHRGPFTSEKPGRLYIRHYYYQDKEYWETKIQRGRADTGTTRNERWERGEDFNTYKND